MEDSVKGREGGGEKRGEEKEEERGGVGSRGEK